MYIYEVHISNYIAIFEISILYVKYPAKTRLLKRGKSCHFQFNAIAYLAWFKRLVQFTVLKQLITGNIS
jgi:hypothetical protein